MKKLVIVSMLILSSCSTTDQENMGTFETTFKGDNVRIVLDTETGCQYIRTSGQSSYTPRLTSEGIPMCGKD